MASESRRNRCRCLCWADPRLLDFATAVSREANDLITIVGAGCPDAAATSRVATTLDAQPIPDLRRALQQDDLDLLLLATSEPLQSQELRQAAASGITMIAIDTRVIRSKGEAADAATEAKTIFAPAFLCTHSFAAAEAELETFGSVDGMALVFTASEREGPLTARLFDGLMTIDRLLGEVESVHAVHSRSDTGSARTAEPFDPSRPGWITGAIAASLQLRSGRSASLLVSNCAGPWRRQVTLTGTGGVMIIDDSSATWLGEISDQPNTPVASPPLPAATPGDLAAHAVAEQLRLLEAAGWSTQQRISHQRLFAVSDAVLLSCRTGQVERPAALQQLLLR